MRSPIVACTLIALLFVSSFSFAVENKIGIGITSSLPVLDGIIPSAEFSIKGIINNIGLQLFGFHGNVSEEDHHLGIMSDIGVSVSYLINLDKNLVLEVGAATNTFSHVSSDSASGSTGSGLLIGLEYFISSDLGIAIRFLPYFRATDNNDNDGETRLGFGSVCVHYYL